MYMYMYLHTGEVSGNIVVFPFALEARTQRLCSHTLVNKSE